MLLLRSGALRQFVIGSTETKTYILAKLKLEVLPYANNSCYTTCLSGEIPLIIPLYSFCLHI